MSQAHTTAVEYTTYFSLHRHMSKGQYCMSLTLLRQLNVFQCNASRRSAPVLPRLACEIHPQYKHSFQRHEYPRALPVPTHAHPKY